MAYTVHQAKTHFSRLLKEAEAGKEVIVMRGTKPIAKIVAIEAPVPTGKRHLAGTYRGKVSWTEGAFDPMTDQDLIECGWGYMAETTVIKPVVEHATSAESHK